MDPCPKVTGHYEIGEFVEKVKEIIGNRKQCIVSKDEYTRSIKQTLESNASVVDDKVLEMIINQFCKQVWEVKVTKNVNIIPDFSTVEENDEFYDRLAQYIKTPDTHAHLCKQYRHLLALPQPTQRTQEWYDMRSKVITASSAAQAMGESKYDKPDKLILEKIGEGDDFKENKYVHHGKKYEKIATMIYENIKDVKIGEFGLILHPTIDFLGASPDGIAMNCSLGGKFSPIVGRMLEIKCPLSREIQTSGQEDGEICPHYYWVQVQLQLECCDLEECDFWQCNLREHETNMFDEDFESAYTEGQNQKVEVDKRFTRGLILQFLPKKPQLDRYERAEWYAKYIYPPKLTFTREEYFAWTEHMSRNYAQYYPDIAKDYYFDKVLHWRLESSHNYLIKRDREWFKQALPKLRGFWERVKLYRSDEGARHQFLSQKKKPVEKASADNGYSFID
jgi:putative phage-type endonuclease